MAYTLCAGCYVTMYFPDELYGDLPDGYIEGVYYCDACDPETFADALLMDGMLDDDKCPACNGTGADPMSDNVNWLPCPSCKGTGKA